MCRTCWIHRMHKNLNKYSMQCIISHHIKHTISNQCFSIIQHLQYKFINTCHNNMVILVNWAQWAILSTHNPGSRSGSRKVHFSLFQKATLNRQHTQFSSCNCKGLKHKISSAHWQTWTPKWQPKDIVKTIGISSSSCTLDANTGIYIYLSN